MPLVVHVESVVDGMILQIGHIPGNVNGSHSRLSLMAVEGRAARPDVDRRVARRVAGRVAGRETRQPAR